MVRPGLEGGADVTHSGSLIGRGYGLKGVPHLRAAPSTRIVVHSLEAAADKPVLVAQRAGGESAAHDNQLRLVQTMADLLQLAQPG